MIKRQKINLTDFVEVTIVIDDEWNDIKNGSVWRAYFNKNSYHLNSDNLNVKNRDDTEKICQKSIGYIHYKIGTGQIGLFYIDDEYRNKGLGTQILLKTIEDIKLHNNKTVWVVAPNNNLFWSNVLNKKFKYSQRPHLSVTGSGYYLKI